MQTIKLITPVGTSLFENYFNDDINTHGFEDDASLVYKQWKTLEHRFSEIAVPLQEWLNALQEGKRGGDIDDLGYFVYHKWALVELEKSSAEIASILAIKRDKYPDKTIEVYLIATDSVLSPLAATIIAQRFREKPESGITVLFHPEYCNETNDTGDVIQHLQLDNAEKFREDGLRHLIRRITKIAKDKQDDKQKLARFEDVALNLTGGYKALLPYLSIVGQLEESPLFYLFENWTTQTQQKIIEIPPLPVDFDFSLIEDNYLAFEQLNKEPQNRPTQEVFTQEGQFEVEEVLDLQKKQQIITVLDGKVSFTVLGKLLFDRYEYIFNNEEFSRQKLLSKLIELRLYEFYVNQFGREKVTAGKLVGQNDFDIDVYIEDDQRITAIEVKPGGNIPILEDKKMSHKKKKETIEYKLTKGGFDYLLNNNRGKDVRLWVIVYFHKEDIVTEAKRQIRQLHQQYPELTRTLEWKLLKLRSDYKKDVTWKVSEDRLRSIDLDKMNLDDTEIHRQQFFHLIEQCSGTIMPWTREELYAR